MAKKWSMIAIGLILIGIAGMMIYKFDFESTDSQQYFNVDKRWTFDSKELSELDIFGSAVNMNVEFIKSPSADSGYVEVKGSVYKDIAERVETAVIADSALSLDMQTNKWDFLSFNFKDRTLYVTVALPEQEMLNNVRLSLSSGNGHYNYVSGKNVSIESSSGNIKFSELSAEQAIDLEIRSGNIKGSGISGNIQVSSKSGNITIDDLEGDSIVKSSSGNVAITQKTAANADITSKSGNVTFTVAKDFAGFYDLRATSGNIKAPDSKPTSQEIVRIRASSGNIKVKEY